MHMSTLSASLKYQYRTSLTNYVIMKRSATGHTAYPSPSTVARAYVRVMDACTRVHWAGDRCFTSGIGSHVLNEVSRVWRCRGSKCIPLPPCLHLQSILNDQGANFPSVFTWKYVSVKAGKEMYISRNVGGEVFLLCTRWQCKMFVVLDSSKRHS